jgi:hypothetical protein
LQLAGGPHHLVGTLSVLRRECRQHHHLRDDGVGACVSVRVLVGSWHPLPASVACAAVTIITACPYCCDYGGSFGGWLFPCSLQEDRITPWWTLSQSCDGSVGSTTTFATTASVLVSRCVCWSAPGDRDWLGPVRLRRRAGALGLWQPPIYLLPLCDLPTNAITA